MARHVGRPRAAGDRGRAPSEYTDYRSAAASGPHPHATYDEGPGPSVVQAGTRDGEPGPSSSYLEGPDHRMPNITSENW